MAIELNWQQEMRNIVDVAKKIPDPVERLRFLERAREEIRDRLTTLYERACFDARLLDRDDEAAVVIGSKKAVTDYSKRWNNRLKGSERVRWSDPFRPHRRQRLVNLDNVAKGLAPYEVAAPVQQKRPQPRPSAQSDGDRG